MARRPAAGGRKAATKLQTPDGADAKPEVAAALSGAAEAKATEGKGSVAADPPGAGAASTAAPEHSREQADVTAADRKAAADEGKQPEETVQPPVVEGELTRVSVRSVSPKGRRRAGQAFGPEPLELHVSAATLELLRGDPLLSVEIG